MLRAGLLGSDGTASKKLTSNLDPAAGGSFAVSQNRFLRSQIDRLKERWLVGLFALGVPQFILHSAPTLMHLLSAPVRTRRSNP